MMSDTTARSQHALRAIELERVLSLVSERAVSEYAAERLLSAAPRSDIAWIQRELRRVEVTRILRRGETARDIPRFPPLRAVLQRLSIEGSSLEGTELRGVADLLAVGKVLRSQLDSDAVPGEVRAELAGEIGALFSDVALERSLARTVAEDGTILDTASPELRRVRRELRAGEGDVVGLLERIAARLPAHQRVPDIAVTMRDGRYVLAIRREAKGSVGGIVHDASASGATLFVEPPAAIELGNRIRELQLRERSEVERILRDLTAELRPSAEHLVASLEALVELDTLYARARFADDLGCAPCAPVPASRSFAIREGRHPLLLAQGVTVVPFTLEMGSDERTLLISGPNTGGKTVLLKSVALFAALIQCGIPASVGADSKIPVFDAFFADVGDEQSIQASLSTFSAHLRNVSVILRSATPESLVLMDEIGSGTDPVEGAALAAAVLEELTRRGTLTLATSHLGALQSLAAEVPGVVNGSLQFDSAQLAPTYIFIKGVPGRSYGISIARRLGLPATIVQRAEERLPKGERDLDALIAELEKRERELAALEQTARAEMERLEEREARVAAAASDLRIREREFEREARRDARRHLLESRALVEEAIRELRESAKESLDEAARASRRKIEERAAAHDVALRELGENVGDNQGDRGEQGVPGDIAIGDHVEVETLGGRVGTVVELRDAEAVVSVGALKATVRRDALSRVAAPAKARESVQLRGQLPEERFSSEIDLRGMRADEVERAMLPAIDAAARSDLRFLRVIHGKGTGALRSRVKELLAGDPRIASYRAGAWNEGGDGVTIVELR